MNVAPAIYYIRAGLTFSRTIARRLELSLALDVVQKYTEIYTCKARAGLNQNSQKEDSSQYVLATQTVRLHALRAYPCI